MGFAVLKLRLQGMELFKKMGVRTLIDPGKTILRFSCFILSWSEDKCQCLRMCSETEDHVDRRILRRCFWTGRASYIQSAVSRCCYVYCWGTLEENGNGCSHVVTACKVYLATVLAWFGDAGRSDRTVTLLSLAGL